MKIRKILVSQPQPAVIEKSPFYEITEKHKATIDYKPFIKVVGVTLKEFRAQRTGILDHTAVIFTNRTTIDSFFHICEEARVTVPESMKYFCMTEAVALYLQKYIVYRKRKIFFADGSFNTFMELILKHKDEKFLLTLSEPHKPEIPVTMDKLKLKHSKVILSKTVSSDLGDVNISDYDLLVFYSPSEIKTLVENFGTDNLPMIAVYGESTVKAAIEAGLSINVMAPMPEIPSMVKAVDILMDKIEHGEKVEPINIAVKSKAEEFIKAQESKPTRKLRKKPASSSASKKSGATAKSTAGKKTVATSKTVNGKAAGGTATKKAVDSEKPKSAGSSKPKVAKVASTAKPKVATKE